MPANQEIARKMDEMVYHYRRKNDAVRASAFDRATTKLRQMDEEVAEMKMERLEQFEAIEDFVAEKIRELVEKGEIEELRA